MSDNGYAPFSKLCLGAKFQYDETKHGEQQTIWVKIHQNLIAKWDPKEIATNWVGQPVCCFTDSDEENALDEVVFIIHD